MTVSGPDRRLCAPWYGLRNEQVPQAPHGGCRVRPGRAANDDWRPPNLATGCGPQRKAPHDKMIPAVRLKPLLDRLYADFNYPESAADPMMNTEL